MIATIFRSTTLALAAGLALTALPFAAAHAEEAMKTTAPTPSADATYGEIQSSMGSVPTFVKLFPKGAVAGAWAEERDLELSDKTALSPKVKALIGLAVAAQIPCTYCIWADTESAKKAGASQEEIAEAVALSGLTRHWSTFFNGMQIDFNQFKAEMGGGK